MSNHRREFFDNHVAHSDYMSARISWQIVDPLLRRYDEFMTRTGETLPPTTREKELLETNGRLMKENLNLKQEIENIVKRVVDAPPSSIIYGLVIERVTELFQSSNSEDHKIANYLVDWARELQNG